MIEASPFRTNVSSSKITTIMGKNIFRSIYEQFMIDTKQLKPEFPETGKIKMKMGNIMEPVIKDLAEKAFDVTLTINKKRWSPNEHPYFSTEFDAVDKVNKVVYEFKNTTLGESDILKSYYAQVQFSMYIIGWSKAKIVYLQNGWDLCSIDVQRDENFIKHMIDVGVYFNSCVDNKTAPDEDYIYDMVENIDFFKIDYGDLKGRGVSVEMESEKLILLYEWADLKVQEGSIKKKITEIKEKLSDDWGRYADAQITYSNSEVERQGSVLTRDIELDFDIDINKYRKEPTRYSKQSIRLKKGFQKRKEEELEEKSYDISTDVI